MAASDSTRAKKDAVDSGPIEHAAEIPELNCEDIFEFFKRNKDRLQDWIDFASEGTRLLGAEEDSEVYEVLCAVAAAAEFKAFERICAVGGLPNTYCSMKDLVMVSDHMGRAERENALPDGAGWDEIRKRVIASESEAAAQEGQNEL